MIVAVDESIPYWKEAFSSVGEIRLFSAHTLTAELVRDVDALVVRSVSPVDTRLLEGSSVRFVASASIGMDHVDQDYLTRKGIHFTNAAGSNANSVGEYIAAALLLLAQRRGWNLSRKSLAIIGAGHVGSAVERKARALGMTVALCDPPLRDSTGDHRYLTLDEVLDADILTLHVPLIRTGSYPTYHMIAAEILNRLTPRQFILNSARGSVIRQSDLKHALEKNLLEGAALDVWENEPRIDYGLLDQVELATPHIAGYSLDGKVRGTELVLDVLCRYFGMRNSWDTRSIFPAEMKLSPEGGTTSQDAVHSVVLQAYDVRRDDANLRALKNLSESEAAARFDLLRTGYQLRPEFHHFVVELSAPDAGLASSLAGLGFKVTQSAADTFRSVPAAQRP